MDNKDKDTLINEYGKEAVNQWVASQNASGGDSNWFMNTSLDDARKQLGGFKNLDIGLNLDVNKLSGDVGKELGKIGGQFSGGLMDGALRNFASQFGIRQSDKQGKKDKENQYDLERQGNNALDRAFENAKRKTATLGGYDKTGKYLLDENGERVLDKDGNPIELTENLRNKMQAEKIAQEENDNQVRSLYQAHKKGLISPDEFAGALMGVFGNLVGEIGNSVKGAVGLQGDFQSKEPGNVENLINNRLAESEKRRAEITRKSQERYLDNLDADRETKKKFEEKLVDWGTDPALSGALQKYNSEKKFGILYKLINEAEEAFGKLGYEDYRNLLVIGHLLESDADVDSLLGIAQQAGKNAQDGLKAVTSVFNPLSLFK